MSEIVGKSYDIVRQSHDSRTKGIYCADLSTIVQFGTGADQTIINAFF